MGRGGGLGAVEGNVVVLTVGDGGVGRRAAGREGGAEGVGRALAVDVVVLLSGELGGFGPRRNLIAGGYRRTAVRNGAEAWPLKVTRSLKMSLRCFAWLGCFYGLILNQLVVLPRIS